MGSGRRPAKSGTLTRRGISGSGNPRMCSTGFSFSICCHSKLTLLAVTSKLSRYWRAQSKSWRVTSAQTSVPLILKVADSTAKGELYFLMYSSRMRPEPWQTTDSASVMWLFDGSDMIARHGETQWVAYHIGGRPGQ